MVQQSIVLMDAAGRRRSPATMPGYLAGRAPHNKGMQYPPDPPRAEEIILVMRQAGDGRHGLRIRALIALLWRGGLRISEALALNETDVDERRGSLLVRHGKGDKRREAGMDSFGFEQVAAWMTHRTTLPPGPLLCVIDGATRGRRWSCTSARRELRQLALQAASGGGSRPISCAMLMPSSSPTKAWRSTSTNASSAIPTWDHVHVSARHRSQRDHRCRPPTPPADHLGRRRPQALDPPRWGRSFDGRGGPNAQHALPASPKRSHRQPPGSGAPVSPAVSPKQ
jgi:integrase